MAKDTKSDTKQDLNKGAETSLNSESNQRPSSEHEVQKQVHKWTPEDLLKIFDEILFSGEYREDITIKNKLKVTFRSRSAEETLETSKFIDGADFKLLATVQEQRAFKNLSYSLLSYQNKDFSKLELKDKATFIGRLPTQVVGMLVDSLSEFDEKVQAACREAEENF